MTSLSDIKTRAGRLLYRQLPEEYAFLDRREDGEWGDLEAYLHGFGHVLDLIRGTTEQAYADAFADPIDFPAQEVGDNREIQTWILPYLAELVGAELLAPDPADRSRELSNAVDWFKTKGTLRNVDSVSDTVSGTETVIVEGWRRVLLTPRLGLPPFTGPAAAMGDGDPLSAPSLPLGTPDLRRADRAIDDPAGANPLYRVSLPRRDATGHRAPLVTRFWKPRAPGGAPCFPGAYDDGALRTPDLRNGSEPETGPHPRRAIVHIRPPSGLFEPGLRAVALPAGSDPLDLGSAPPDQLYRFGPEEMLKLAGDPLDGDGDLVTPAPDKIVVTGDLTLPAGVMVAFEDLLFTGEVTIPPNPAHPRRLLATRCAFRKLRIEAASDTPALEATDCLFDEIISVSGYAQLVYCTVLGETHLERLRASDSLFAGDLVGVNCGADETCLRYSRLPNLAALAGCAAEHSPTNTTHDVNFLRLFFDDDPCILRPASFGEPGCGVLDLTTSARVASGAEDEGEMGVGHHLYQLAKLDALRRKLSDFLPLGQEIALRYDPHLTRPPASTI